VSYDGYGAEVLAARLGTPLLHVLPEVTSVLDALHGLAGDGAGQGTVVLADTQTRGRGRQGRAWHSPPGRGVWLGFLVRPDSAPAAALLSVRVGLAVADALEGTGFAVGLKWPNDVVLADRKVAGILCETRWQEAVPAWVAVGIGINVRGPVPPDVATVATALDAVGAVTRVTVLEQLLPRLHALPGGSTLSAEERARWAVRDWLAGRRLAEPVAGIARGLDADGALRVETNRGIRRALAGHVVVA
jgi:BirA family biotin operon repressor/biotin-[acetyl-CoA-carboxylase] ligase